MKLKEFYIGNGGGCGWLVKEINENFEPTTFLDVKLTKVREVSYELDIAIQTIVEALEYIKVHSTLDTVKIVDTKFIHEALEAWKEANE